MATKTLRVSGPAQVDEVWDRYADTRRWSQWSPQIRSVELPDGPMIATGLVGTIVAVGGLRLGFTITSVDTAHRVWCWRVKIGPIGLTLDHGVELGPDSAGSSTWLRVHGGLPFILVYAPVARLAMKQLVRE